MGQAAPLRLDVVQLLSLDESVVEANRQRVCFRLRRIGGAGMGCRADKCGDRAKPCSGGILLAVGVSPRNRRRARGRKPRSGGERARLSGASAAAVDVALSGLEEESNVCLHPVG